jgi:RNA-binding motif protein, X-linked 2
MNSIRNIARLNEAELEKCTPPNASWHTDYRDTAYIYIGGLPFELSEGDVMLLFSQYGNPTDVKLARDKDTGKSRGFAWLKYEDQRSTDLAVDNLSGATVLGRTISVDHARYKMKEGERETVGDDVENDVDDTDAEGETPRKRRKSEGSESEEERPTIKEEMEVAKLMNDLDDDDPMKATLVQNKKEEVREALMKVKTEKKHKHRHRHRSRRDTGGDEEDRDDRRNGHSHRSKRHDEGHRRRRRSRSAEEYPKRRRSKSDDSERDEDRRRKRSDHDRSRRRDPSED